MNTYRVETVVLKDGELNIHGLPLHTGDKVEVIVKSQSLLAEESGDAYSLRDKPIYYSNPFDSVAEDEWNMNADT